MLNIFNKILKDNGLYLNKELRRIPSTCCSNLTTDVLDFDLIKDTFYTNIGLSQNDKLKSADVLKIIPSQNKIVLIEMKKYDITGGYSIVEFIKNRIDGFQNKIIDSVFIILGIVGFYNIDPAFYNYFFNPTDFKIKAVFVSNISYKAYVAADIASLPSHKISISRRIDNNISFLTCEMFFEAVKNKTL